MQKNKKSCKLLTINALQQRDAHRHKVLVLRYLQIQSIAGLVPTSP